MGGTLEDLCFTRNNPVNHSTIRHQILHLLFTFTETTKGLNASVLLFCFLANNTQVKIHMVKNVNTWLKIHYLPI